MKKYLALLLVLLVTMVACQAEGPRKSSGNKVSKSDPALASMRKAEDFYLQGRYRDAMRELKEAMAQVKESQTKALGDLLPPPPRGWQASAPSSAPLAPEILGGGVKVFRHYTGPQGEEVEVCLISQSPLIHSVLSLISSVSLMGQIGNTRLFYYRGEKALERFYPQEKRGELDVVVNGKTLVLVKGENISQVSLLKGFLDDIDWNRVKDLLG